MSLVSMCAVTWFVANLFRCLANLTHQTTICSIVPNRVDDWSLRAFRQVFFFERSSFSEKFPALRQHLGQYPDGT